MELAGETEDGWGFWWKANNFRKWVLWFQQKSVGFVLWTHFVCSIKKREEKRKRKIDVPFKKKMIFLGLENYSLKPFAIPFFLSWRRTCKDRFFVWVPSFTERKLRLQKGLGSSQFMAADPQTSCFFYFTPSLCFCLVCYRVFTSHWEKKEKVISVASRKVSESSKTSRKRRDKLFNLISE